MLRHSWQHTCLTLTVTPGTLLSLYCTNASVAQSLKALHDLRNGFHANQQHTIYKTNNTRKTEVILSCSLLQCIVFFFCFYKTHPLTFTMVPGPQMFLKRIFTYVLYCNLHLCGRNWKSWPSSSGLQSTNIQHLSGPHLRVEGGVSLNKSSSTLTCLLLLVLLLLTFTSSFTSTFFIKMKLKLKGRINHKLIK